MSSHEIHRLLHEYGLALVFSIVALRALGVRAGAAPAGMPDASEVFVGPGSAAVTTGSGEGGVARIVVAETGLGAVEIGIADGSAAWLDLNTHFGHLHNTLEAGGPPGPNDDRVEVRARSAMGDITVHRSYPLADDGSVI
jgi:hypothetical protein